MGRSEIDLLLSCAYVGKDPARTERLCLLLQQPLDWVTVLQLASRHGLIPLLSWRLQEHREVAPRDFFERLDALFQENMRRTLRLTGELVTLVREGSAKGIPLLPFKGPTLAAAVYEHLALRQFNDLDILV